MYNVPELELVSLSDTLSNDESSEFEKYLISNLNSEFIEDRKIGEKISKMFEVVIGIRACVEQLNNLTHKYNDVISSANEEVKKLNNLLKKNNDEIR